MIAAIVPRSKVAASSATREATEQENAPPLVVSLDAVAVEADQEAMIQDVAMTPAEVLIQEGDVVAEALADTTAEAQVAASAEA